MGITNHKEKIVEKQAVFSFNQQEDPFDDDTIHFISPQKHISLNGKSLEIRHLPDWNFTSKNKSFSLRVFLIGENILLTRMKGKMTTSDASATYRLLKNIIDETKLGRYYYIEDLGKILSVGRQTRNKIRKLDKTLAHTRICTYLILPQIGHTMYSVFNTTYRNNVNILPSIKEAMLACTEITQTAQPDQNNTDKPVPLDLQKVSRENLMEMISQLREENATLKNHQHHHISQLSSILGQTLWGENADFQKLKLSTKDEYYQLYEALSLLLKDFQQLQAKRNTIQEKQTNPSAYIITPDKAQTPEYFRLLSEHTLDLMCLITPHGLISYTTPSVTVALGYSQEELRGKSIFRYIHPEDTSRFLSSEHTSFFLRDQALLEFRILKKDQSYEWLESVSTAIKNKDEKVEHIVVSARSHQEKKQISLQLSTREEELKSTLEGMSESVYVFDKNGVLVTTNQQKNKDYFIERSCDALIGKAYQEIFADTFIHKLNKAIRVACTTQLKHEFEYMVKREGEEKAPDHYKICVLARKDISGDFAGITMITRNVTASKRLKEQNAALEKANEELDHFVYSASHDLRAPLASTLGLINITRITDDMQEKANYLNLMEISLQKMDRYIHDITDYSRNARLSIELEKIEFGELVNDVIQTLSYHENIHKIDFLVNADDTIPFYSDYSRINIIFRNIISNAIKYHDLTRSHPYLSIDIKITQQAGIFRFEDNGIGIEEKYIDKIFDMFYQASPESFGSGLGLYIVKEAMSKLKGSIQVVSTTGQGSVFTITFPNHSEKLPNL